MMSHTRPPTQRGISRIKAAITLVGLITLTALALAASLGRILG
ncbi:hypothetical protein ACFY91_24530 [Streptomyces albogriseolus]